MRCFVPFLALGVVSASTATTATSSMPTVKLDYCTVQAVSKLSNVDVYKYQNIRFAAPVTQANRFMAPQAVVKETAVNTGSLAESGVSCSSTEDCLFLDVYAPLNGKSLTVWVDNYGGGFTGGSKTELSPSGLYDLSTKFISVGYNYRLGITALGNGPTYQHTGGVSNLNVWDAEAAFKWVKKYIKKFGGNPNDVMASGFSAGGSQVLFQMTRFGGRAEQLFQKAYVMSPGFVPGAGHYHQESFWQDIASKVGCSGGNVSCMRTVDFSTLNTAATSVASDYISGTFQPKVDGYIVSDTPEANLYHGHFNFSGPCVLSHGLHEANSQAYSGVDTDDDVTTMIRKFFPGIQNGSIEELLAVYPASDYSAPGYRFSDMKQTFDLVGKQLAATHALKNKTWNVKHNLGGGGHGGDQSYYWYSNSSSSSSTTTTTTTTTTNTTAGSVSGNAAVTASSMAGSAAAGNSTTGSSNSSTAGGPGGAGGAPGGSDSSSTNATLAVQIQKYFLSFMLTGNPNKMWPNDKPYWPLYNEKPEGIVNFFNTTGITTGDDDLATAKTVYFNKALWY